MVWRFLTLKQNLLFFCLLTGLLLALFAAIHQQNKRSNRIVEKTEGGLSIVTTFWSDSPKWTNSLLTYRDKVLDGAVIRYERPGIEHFGGPMRQRVGLLGVYRNGLPWNGRFICFGANTNQTIKDEYWVGSGHFASGYSYVTYSNGILSDVWVPSGMP